jgi:glycosyltransferase involved in cell wall biosynthesis
LLQISLIICTYNRADLLPNCLVHATTQSLPSGGYEVIVVDNASSDHTQAIVQQFPVVRYLYCATRGLSSARNTGVAASRAPLVAFIDDDCLADPNLLAELAATFALHSDAGCAGGAIDVRLPEPLPHWYAQQFAGYFGEYTPSASDIHRVTDLRQYPFGGNLAIRKQAILEAGYFSEKLGRVGANQAGGEELDLQHRIAQRGYGIYVNPKARVTHVILPRRMTWSHVVRSARAAGRNWAYYETELLHTNSGVRHDLRLLIGAIARLPTPGGFHIALHDCWFFSAKVLQKLRYRSTSTAQLHEA